MNIINTDQTLTFTKDLTILYAEDDLELQTQTKDFFEVLFKKVTVANNGLDALNLFKTQHFDIVVSDVKMPLMNGVELCHEIRKINPDQAIIIVSAYNDSQTLMEFININIKQFIQKPIDVDNMLETLYFTSKGIVNEKMVEEYRIELEKNNQELLTKNEELQSLVRILDSKLTQHPVNKSSQSKDLDVSKAEIVTDDLSELKELEIDINGAAVIIKMTSHLDKSNIEILGKLFISYASLIHKYELYEELCTYIDKLGISLSDAPESFTQRVGEISILLESFIYVLKMWRNNIVNKEFEKAFYLHISMINDIKTIISIVDGTENEIESEMDFF